MLSTIRLLRAFVWLRWRVLLNSFERHGGRDVVERFSVAIEQLTPILVILLMVPSALMLTGAGSYAGWLLAQGELRVVTLELLRYFLFAGCIFAAVAPIVLPSGDRTNLARMLILPIPRGLLYVAQTTSTAVDPWMMLIVAVVASIPVGLVMGGALTVALAVVMAGAALLLVLTGLTLTVATLVQLAVRDRRRGEILALLFIVVVPMLGVLPGLLHDGRDPPDRAASRPQSDEPGVWANAGRAAFALVPSEIYVRTVRNAAQDEAIVPGIAALIAASAALHGFAFVLFTRMLSSPVVSGGGGSQTRWGVRLPGVRPATSAVALAQLKLGLRTPRGRSTILSPIVLFVVFGAVMARSGARDFGFIALDSGLALASFTSFVALLSIAPLAMNQFAIDGAGLTLTFLAPVDTRDLVAGKALGNALIAAIPATLCTLGALALVPTGHPALWLCVPLSLIATYLLVAPGAATLSAVFPKTVDMNSIGRSNAHGAAGLLGTLLFLAAGTPCLLLVLAATRLFERPSLAPLFLLLWTIICAASAYVLSAAVVALVERRRENLAMVIT